MQTKFKLGSKIKVVSVGRHVAPIGAEGVIVEISKSPFLGSMWFLCEVYYDNRKVQQIFIEKEIEFIKE